MSRLFDDASSEYLRSTSTPLTAAPLTFACWFYADATVGAQAVCINSSGANRYFAIDIWSDSYISATTRQSSATFATATTTYSTNTWHHACAVFAASNDRRIYQDGGNKGTDTGNQSPSSIDGITLGSNFVSGNPAAHFSGRLAEVAFWDVALTDDEAAALATGIRPIYVRPSGLVAYWPLIRDTDQDFVGGYNLTPLNTPTVADHPPTVIYPVPQFKLVPSAASPVSVTLSTITLASSAETSTVSPGAIAILLSAISLAASAETATVTPGAIAVLLSAISLASSAEISTVSPGAIAVLLNALSLSSSAETATVSPGAIAVLLNALSLTASAETLSVVEILEVLVLLSTLSVAASAETATVTPGAVAVVLSEISLAASAETLLVTLFALARLTLKKRDIALVLQERDIDLNLASRDIDLTLPED